MTLAAGVVHGPLISRTFLAERTQQSHLARIDPALLREARRVAFGARELGPASPVRAIADRIAIPLAHLLGFTVREVAVSPSGTLLATLAASCGPVAALAVRPAGDPPGGRRLEVVRETLARRLRWALVCTARELRLMDCRRPHAQRWLAVALDAAPLQLEVVAVMTELLSADALEPHQDGRSRLEEAIAEADQQLQRIRNGLQRGVEQAALTLTASIARSRQRHGTTGDTKRLNGWFEEALTVVYRILFLMFAESRGLVPVWHPIYREAYTIERLRDLIARGGDARGTWDGLQAIARLAHRGARAGTLQVTPFNGRLFSPRHAPSVARCAIGDRDAASVVAALTLHDSDGVRRQVPFVDLGVEQLGAVYERVLDLVPDVTADGAALELRKGGARKSTGSFYTPRSVTEFVVRRALHPLVAEASPERILSLRVLDPAMGSGAFLVAACRYLAHAYELALVQSGEAGGSDFSVSDRAGFRRLVAQRCLFGVDVNPMAVQLGRLSLWLCALSAGKPLTFLDHHLRVGNSLAGASLEDEARQAPGRSRRARPDVLFDDRAFDAIGSVVTIRRALAATPDDNLQDVREKERAVERLDAAGGPLARWRALLDLWCATWFWPPDEKAPDAREYGALAAALRGDESLLHASARARLARAADAARRARFFHWPLEFPEVLFAEQPGFDAVIGNPPWDMLREEDGSRQLLRFSRESGVYRAQSEGQANIYQLFVERMMQLVRPGGRLALVLPWGFAADAGSASVRRLLLDRCEVDEIAGLENRGAIFPIHRALKFLIVHATARGRTETLRCRLGVSDVHALDQLPDRPGAPGDGDVLVPRELLIRTSGEALAIPYLRSSADVLILERLSRAGPPLGDRSGWCARFGRELNATDDRALLTRDGDGVAVIGGRNLSAFAVDVPSNAPRVTPGRLPPRLRVATARTRLAYRDVAGAGNRMTLIAALVPRGTVTTHTLFCLKSPLARDDQLFLCALFNSYVLNYLVRLRVGTHVTTAIVEALPVPRPSRSSSGFRRIVSLAASVSRERAPHGAAAALHAAVAWLYGLDEAGFAHVLSTFPLVDKGARDEAQRYHTELVRGRVVFSRPRR